MGRDSSLPWEGGPLTKFAVSSLGPLPKLSPLLPPAWDGVRESVDPALRGGGRADPSSQPLGESQGAITPSWPQDRQHLYLLSSPALACGRGPRSAGAPLPQASLFPRCLSPSPPWGQRTRGLDLSGASGSLTSAELRVSAGLRLGSCFLHHRKPSSTALSPPFHG